MNIVRIDLQCCVGELSHFTRVGKGTRRTPSGLPPHNEFRGVKLFDRYAEDAISLSFKQPRGQAANQSASSRRCIQAGVRNRKFKSIRPDLRSVLRIDQAHGYQELIAAVRDVAVNDISSTGTASRLTNVERGTWVRTSPYLDHLHRVFQRAERCGQFARHGRARRSAAALCAVALKRPITSDMGTSGPLDCCIAGRPSRSKAPVDQAPNAMTASKAAAINGHRR